MGASMANVEWANNTLTFVQHGLYAGGGVGASVNLKRSLDDRRVQLGTIVAVKGLASCGNSARLCNPYR